MRTLDINDPVKHEGVVERHSGWRWDERRRRKSSVKRLQHVLDEERRKKQEMP
jgi:hypothetical protein